MVVWIEAHVTSSYWWIYVTLMCSRIHWIQLLLKSTVKLSSGNNGEKQQFIALFESGYLFNGTFLRMSRNIKTCLYYINRNPGITAVIYKPCKKVLKGKCTSYLKLHTSLKLWVFENLNIRDISRFQSKGK